MQNSLLYKAPLAVSICSFAFLTLFFVPQQKYPQIRKIIGFICLMVCVLSALYVSNLYLTGTPLLNRETLYNFDVYYYPVFEVFNGKVLSLDFNNIYGFYPYILAPILKLTGSISIQKFSLITAILVLITLMSLLAVVWINIKNKLIALIGYLAIEYFIIISPLSLGEFYYAYQPHRIIFPALILLVGSLFVHAKNKMQKNILICIGFITACLSLIWNLDTGMIITIAWSLLLLYTLALDCSFKNWILYKKALITVLLTILTAAASYGIIALITFGKSGVWIGVAQCFFAQEFFYKYGFNMVPMLESHPWVILVILYAIGLIISLPNMKFLAVVKTTCIRSRSSLYFFVSVIGVGLFSYYQGRSHDNVFLSVIWPGAIIAVMLMEDYYNAVIASLSKLKNEAGSTIPSSRVSGSRFAGSRINSILRNNPESIFGKAVWWTNITKFVLLLFLLVSFMLAVPYTALFEPGFSDIQHGSSSDFSNQVNIEVRLLKETIRNDNTVNLLISEQDFFYTMLQMENRTGITSSADWFRREDYDKALHWLNTTQEDLIIDTYMRAVLSKYDNQETKRIIYNRFEVKDIGEGYYLLTVKH